MTALLFVRAFIGPAGMKLENKKSRHCEQPLGSRGNPVPKNAQSYRLRIEDRIAASAKKPPR